jgi:hypothetical protein
MDLREELLLDEGEAVTDGGVKSKDSKSDAGVASASSVAKLEAGLNRARSLPSKVLGGASKVLGGSFDGPNATLRGMFNERSHELREFVAPLEKRVRECFKYRSKRYRNAPRAQRRVAQLVLEVLRQLAYRETGVFNLEVPVLPLLSVLCAGGVEVGIVNGLARRAAKALAQYDTLERESYADDNREVSSTRSLRYDTSRELDELLMLLKWYVKRKTSLLTLELDQAQVYKALDGREIGLDEYERESDSIFGVNLIHDHQLFGVKGFLLGCGLRLYGRDGEALWLRVSLFKDGEPVMVRPNWSTWSDPVGGGGAAGSVMLLPEEAVFCSLVPIRPNSQRLVIDEVRAFVPYAALRLPVGRSDLLVVTSVLDGAGREVLSASRIESICVPHSQLALSPVPAPHSLGMWPHDVVSGDQISDLSVFAGYKVLAGWERHSISVSFDLSLFMHAGEGVMLEVRFVDDSGRGIELSSLGVPFIASELNVAVESISSYRYRRILHPKGAWALYHGLCIDIPVEFLQLEAGRQHDIICELVIVSGDERVLCGDMGRVSVYVPYRAANPSASSNSSSTGAVAQSGLKSVGVKLDSFDIEPLWDFGGDDSVRIEVELSPQSDQRQLMDLAAGRVGELLSPYRVEVSLEKEDGHTLLQAYSDRLGMSFKPVTRSVCIDPSVGQLKHSVVANFKKGEILGWSYGGNSGLGGEVGSRGGAKLRIFARISVFSLGGELILSESRDLFVKALPEGGREIVKIKEAPATVVDVVAFLNAQGERLSVRAVINTAAAVRGDEGIRVNFGLISKDGGRAGIFSRDLSPEDRGVWTREVAGLCQYVVECDYAIPQAARGENLTDSAVEVILVSRAEDTLHRVVQAVRVSGVLSEVDENAADFDSDVDSAAFDRGGIFSAGQHGEVGNTTAEAGFIKRLLNRLT